MGRKKGLGRRAGGASQSSTYGQLRDGQAATRASGASQSNATTQAAAGPLAFEGTRMSQSTDASPVSNALSTFQSALRLGTSEGTRTSQSAPCLGTTDGTRTSFSPFRGPALLATLFTLCLVPLLLPLITAQPALAAECFTEGAYPQLTGKCKPGWEVTSTTFPTALTPGGGTGVIEVNVYNIGAEKSGGTVTVTDTLPEGIVAIRAGDLQESGENIGGDGLWDCSVGHVVTCINNQETLPSLPRPNLGIQGREAGAESISHIAIEVEVEPGTPEGTLTNHVTVAGGGALAPASTSSSIDISTAEPKFGFADSDGWFSNADGTVDTQAGSHPYEYTYSFDLNTIFHHEGPRESLVPAGGEPRDYTLNLPPGFVGNPTAVPQCTRQQFEEEGHCSPSTQVGTATAGIRVGSLTPLHVSFPIYNLVPPSGIPAQFGFQIFQVPVYLDAGVRSGGDYGFTVHSNNIVQQKIMYGRITFWGEPSNSSHNEDRSSETEGEICRYGCSSGAPHVPFLTLPTSCTPEAPVFSASLNAWEIAAFGETSYKSHDSNDTPTGFTGCDHLGFGPSISVAPDTSEADTPAGLTVDVRVPQEGLSTPGALASANIKNTVVALPVGTVINPGQAAGLQACPAGPASTEPGHEKFGDNLPLSGENGEEERFNGPANCPGASKVGTVRITTPLLNENLEGNVYVLQSDPPNLKLIVAASGGGVNVKVVGDVSLCEKTGEELHGKSCEAPGQLITKFTETPELPFSDFKLSFSGGAQAALATPATCRDETAAYPGTYTTNTDFASWATPYIPDAFPSSNFAINSGPNGSSCPSAQLPFTPSLTAGGTTDEAGSFTGFSMLLKSADAQQRIEKLSFVAPPGLSGYLSNVPLCPEPQAAAGTCPTSSQIGHTVVQSGPGPYPLTIPQPGEPESPIYLTGPTNGSASCTVGQAGCAPFGLTIVTHVIAGPFDLEKGTTCDCIVTRAKIEINPYTAQITVTTGELPQIIDGVPTDLRLVNAVIDKPDFMINPTNCTPSSFSGTANGAPPPGSSGPGTSAAIGDHFQVGACRSLGFAPKFAVSTQGRTSKANGASLHVSLTYPSGTPGTYANVARVKVELPKILPSRLTTLQKACTAAQFEANPSGCPAASIIGTAKAISPIIPVPLVGPAYFVSHGGEAFPSLIMVLQGYGVTLDLVGTTFISKSGITSSTFKTVPDQPVGSFELNLPEKPFSALAANGNLCSSAAKLTMPTEFVGQNGAEIHETTKISVSGCKPAITVLKHRTSGGTATITVSVPSAGKLVASARGTSKASKNASGATTLTVKLTVTRAEAAFLKRHKGRKLKAKVKLTFTPKKGAKLKTTTTVLIGA
jgi:hypothetical protein